MFTEHEQIVLTAAVMGDEQKELKPGDVGAIIHNHPNKEASVAELLFLDGETVAIATVPPSTARPVTGHGISQARTVPPTVWKA